MTEIMCTLTEKGRERRQLEWSDLASLATSRTPLPNGLTSTYPVDLADQIADLATREMSCCGSWITIEHRRADGQVELTVTAETDQGVEVIQSFMRPS